ncbi:hypothetical protein QL285_067390 [Trifolium repens]|nr:hypothetical protein QL285_067390 [Trifolium repens]
MVVVRRALALHHLSNPFLGCSELEVLVYGNGSMVSDLGGVFEVWQLFGVFSVLFRWWFGCFWQFPGGTVTTVWWFCAQMWAFPVASFAPAGVSVWLLLLEGLTMVMFFLAVGFFILGGVGSLQLQVRWWLPVKGSNSSLE